MRLFTSYTREILWLEEYEQKTRNSIERSPLQSIELNDTDITAAYATSINRKNTADKIKI
jgi:hypothetical protein